MERARTVTNHGRAITIGLSVILAASVFLPNGSYRSGSAVVSINALAAPFEDYGSTEFAIGVIVMLIVGALWATRWRPQHSEFGTVAAYAGILGLILPDLWLRNSMTVTDGTGSRRVDVNVEWGFWLNISIVVVLLVVSSFFLWSEHRSHPTSRAVRGPRPSDRRFL
jgi:hypothetical protein